MKSVCSGIIDVKSPFPPHIQVEMETTNAEKSNAKGYSSVLFLISEFQARPSAQPWFYFTVVFFFFFFLVSLFLVLPYMSVFQDIAQACSIPRVDVLSIIRTHYILDFRHSSVQLDIGENVTYSNNSLPGCSHPWRMCNPYLEAIPLELSQVSNQEIKVRVKRETSKPNPYSFLASTGRIYDAVTSSPLALTLYGLKKSGSLAISSLTCRNVSLKQEGH
jgi:hypothetical protein